MNGVLSRLAAHPLTRNTVIYALGGFLQEAVPFLMLPILTRYLTPHDYGVTATFMVVFSVCFVFVGLSLQGALAVNYFKRPPEERPSYLSATLVIQTLAFFLVASVAWLARRKLAAVTEFPADWFVIVALCSFCHALSLSALTLWQIEQRPVRYTVFRVLMSGFNVGLSLVLVVSLGWDWRGRAVGMTLSLVGGAIAAMVILARRTQLTWRIRSDHLVDALAFGLPLIPHGLSGIFSDAINRLFINKMVSVEETGIYSVGYQIGSILLFAVTAFNYAYGPFLLAQLPTATDQTKRLLVRLTYVYALSVTLVALLLGAASPLLLRVLAGGEFFRAARYVPWTAASAALAGLYFMVVNYIFYAQKTYWLAAATFTSGLCAVGLTWILVPRFGAMGAAYATVVANALTFLLTWALAQRLYPMPWMTALRRTVVHA